MRKTGLGSWATGDVLTIIYDKDGQHYHQGKGLRLLVNGKLAAQRKDLGKLEYKK